jgi:hypothetical protein
MAANFTPRNSDRLEHLRDRHVRMALRADEVLRLYRDGEATWNDVCEAERNERQAYIDWRLLKTASTVLEPRLPQSVRRSAFVPRDL